MCDVSLDGATIGQDGEIPELQGWNKLMRSTELPLTLPVGKLSLEQISDFS